MLVGLFCRVNIETRDLLNDVLKGMNSSRVQGEGRYSVGSLIERCVLESIAPAKTAGALPGQLPLFPRKRKGRKK